MVKLSQRETEVANLVMRGYANKQIAQMLIVSLSTVRKHLEHIYYKLGLYNPERKYIYVRRVELTFALIKNQYNLMFDFMSNSSF